MKTIHNIKNENVYDLIHNFKVGQKSSKTIVTTDDFYSSSNDVFHIDTTWVYLKDIVLPLSIKNDIQDVIEEYSCIDYLQTMNLTPSNKIILEGEPWCWKTMIAYALSNMLWRELKVVNLSKIVSSHLWETTLNISSIFNKYNNHDHILFIDEFDIVWRLRWDWNNDHNEMKRVVNSLLQLIDYFPIEWFLIFATNDINIIDKALLRRMDKVINIPMPDKTNIKKFIKLKLKNYNQSVLDIDYDFLANMYKWSSYSIIDRSIKNSLKKYIIKNKKVKNLIITTQIFKK